MSGRKKVSRNNQSPEQLFARLQRSWARRRELEERVERLRQTLTEIEAVACGEEQVADDDTGGLAWIWQRCKVAGGGD